MEAPAEPRPVVKVIKVSCSPTQKGKEFVCKNSKSGLCTHGSAALQALQCLPRVAGVGATTVKTDACQVWHVPSAGTMYESYAPACMMPLKKPDRQRIKERRFVVCLAAGAGRLAYDPLPPAMRAARDNRSSPAREAARIALLKRVREDNALVQQRQAKRDRAKATVRVLAAAAAVAAAN